MLQTPGRDITLKSFIWNFTPVQFEFYSFPSLHTACEVIPVLIVVVSTQTRSETKYPES